MEEDSILLIEEIYENRLQHVIRVAEALGIEEYYPKSHESVDALLQVDKWLNLIFTKKPYVCVNLHIGDDGGTSNRITVEEVTKIIAKIRGHNFIQNLDRERYFDRINKLSAFPKHQIAGLVTLISQVLGLRCAILVTSGKLRKIEDLLVEDDDKDEIKVDRYFRESSLDDAFNSDNLYNAISPTLSLEGFWEKTKRLNCHSEINNQDCQKAFKLLKQFIGISPNKPWIGNNLNDDCIEECLKTMCGITANVGEGTYTLSLLGAYHILLGAIANSARKPANALSTNNLIEKDSINIEIEKNNGSFAYLNKKKVLPFQTQELAKLTINLLYEIFKRLIIFRGNSNDSRNGRVLIQSIKLNKDGMEITLGIDLIKDKKIGRTYGLAGTLHQIARSALVDYVKKKDLINPHPSFSEFTEGGELSRFMLAFNQATIIHDQNNFWVGNLDAPKLIFPQHRSIIKIYSIGNTTLLKLCLIS